MKQSVFLSIVVCTYNREKYLFNLLESLVNCKLDKSLYEIIVVDNNSTDNTKKETTRFTEKYSEVSFNCVFEAQQGLSYARNRGIKEASGKFIVYVDDDALVSDNYLDCYYDFFISNPTALAAGGPVVAKYECGEEPEWMSKYTRQLITGEHLPYGNEVCVYGVNKYPGGGNCAIKKSVFEKIGLFNVELGRSGGNAMGGEEKDIFDKMRAAGMQIYYLPKPRLFHLIPDSKLTADYFDRVSFAVGVSERKRTKAISNAKYCCSIVKELAKWGATIILWCYYTLKLSSSKANKLIAFRCNVTRGLLYTN